MDRYFYVKLQKAYSNLHTVLAGVFQNSVLGSVLYLIFTADINILWGNSRHDTTPMIQRHYRPTQI